MTTQVPLTGILNRPAASNPVSTGTRQPMRPCPVVNPLSHFMRKLPLILIALLLSSGLLTAAVPPPDKLLPSETFFVVTVPNWAAAQKNAGPLFQLWDDSAL